VDQDQKQINSQSKSKARKLLPRHEVALAGVGTVFLSGFNVCL
jgi:hypothetical protein